MELFLHVWHVEQSMWKLLSPWILTLVLRLCADLFVEEDQSLIYVPTMEPTSLVLERSSEKLLLP